MTVGLLIQPCDTPALLTDTLITWEDCQPETFLIPGNLNSRPEQFITHLDEITRKLYFLNSQIAVAVAGCESPIIDFLNEAKSQINVITSYSDPMIALKGLADNYGPSVSTLIALRTSGGEFRNWLGGTCEREIATYGRCGAIGSGANDVMALAAKDGPKFGTYSAINKSLYSLSASMFGVAIARMIGNSLTVGEPKDWGGFGEWAFFDRSINSWSYSKPAVYGFALAIPLPGRRFTIELNRWFVGYDPGSDGNTPAVVSVNVATGNLYQWMLRDVTVPVPNTPRSLDSWRDWVPHDLMFEIVAYGKEPIANVYHAGSYRYDRGNFKFEISSNHIARQVNQSLINAWAEPAARWWDRTYVPLNQISDDIMVEAFANARKGGWSE